VPGQVVVVGDLIGVAKGAGTTGDLVIVDLEGVFTLPKATPETWGTQGAKLYYDATAKKVTTDDDSGNNPQIGYVETTAGSTAAEGRVLLLRS
jgi:predicted RecA/RadA family phage recombinase